MAEEHKGLINGIRDRLTANATNCHWLVGADWEGRKKQPVSISLYSKTLTHTHTFISKAFQYQNGNSYNKERTWESLGHTSWDGGKE